MICRDEIKEGLVHAEEAYTPERGDALNRRTAETFFEALQFFVEGGVTVVAEASFQHGLWAHGLAPVVDKARVRIVRCRLDPAGAWERMTRRAVEEPARRAIHGDYSLDEPFESFEQAMRSFEPVALPVPTIEVDPGEVSDSALDEIVAFVNRAV